jgi:hypothetical protein
MKKLALPLVINGAWALFAFINLLSAIKTQQPGRITAAAIGTAVPFIFVLLLVRQVVKLRTKHLGA